MALISNYIEKYKTDILEDKIIEFFIWKYLLNNRIFTIEIIVKDYLKKEFGLYIQIVKRLSIDYETYRNIKNDLKDKFKMTLDKLRLGKMVKELRYSNKIYSVGDII